MRLSIRKGKKEDLSAVLSLIKELALYENALNEVSISVEELEEDGFGDNPYYQLQIAEIGDQVVGIALYYFKYSTWKGKCIYLEDLVVSEKYRHQGIGSKLFESIIDISKKLNVKRLEWQVLDWNKPAIKFYKKYNASLDGEWLNGKLTMSQLQNFGNT